MKIDGKYLLGISAGYHDSAAALIKDGKVLGAVEEERFTCIKHDASFPFKSIKWLLEDNNITGKDIFSVCYYENPNEKLDRIKSSLERGGFKNILQRPRIVYQNQQQIKDFEKLMVEHTHSDVRIVWGDHHFSHAAYSYYTSGFQKSAIVTVDGVGEWDTTGLFYAEEILIDIKKSLKNFIPLKKMESFHSTWTTLPMIGRRKKCSTKS